MVKIQTICAIIFQQAWFFLLTQITTPLILRRTRGRAFPLQISPLRRPVGGTFPAPKDTENGPGFTAWTASVSFRYGGTDMETPFGEQQYYNTIPIICRRIAGIFAIIGTIQFFRCNHASK